MAPADPAEDFRDVPGFPGYRISSLGRIQSRRAPGPGSGLRETWKDLKPHRERGSGHLTVTLRCRGQKHTLPVHRVVLEAFVGPCPAGADGRHADGNPANNRLDNLRWDTQEQARTDAGTRARGRHPRARLTDEAVAEMCRLRAEGARLKDLAARFGTSVANASGITRGRYWKHVARPTREGIGGANQATASPPSR